MDKLLLVIEAVLVTTVSRSDGAVTLPLPLQLFQQGSDYTINCQITGEETFFGWETPPKPPRSGKPAIPSQTITLATKGRREVVQDGDNYGLSIKVVTADDGGVYRCVGNSTESKEFTANVDMNINNVQYTQTLHLGRKETLVLGVSAYPALTYTWTKDEQPVSFDKRRTLDGYTGSITFSPVQLTDQGNYTCNVLDNAGSSHHFESISVQLVDSPVINKYQRDPVKCRLTQGYNVTFHCDIRSGTPYPTITFWYGWTDKVKKVDPTYTPRHSHPTVEEWTITGITTEDKGKYRCIAENVAGQDELKIEITEVDIPPKIDPPLTDVEVDEGVDRVVQCKVSGLPAPTVEWFDENGVRVPDQRTEEDGNKIVQNMRFRNVQWRNSGKYTCRARNGALDGDEKIIVEEQTISFNVNSPPRLLSSPNPVYSYMGNQKPTIILCKFSGYPAPLVKMVNQNRTEVASGNGSASFTIPSTDSEDVFGKYNCSAVNKFGNDGVLLELKVAVAPSPPRQVFANTTCKDVTLKWDHPESDGGMVITNYVIRLLKDAMRTLHQETVPGNLREADINYDDFKAETTYGMELVARNDVGYGKKESLFVTTKKYCVPGKPTITNAESEVDSTFILTWLKPNYDGLDSVIKYKVEWRKKPIITDASVVFEEENINATQLTVNNLEGGAEYEFKVFAVNRAGLSEADTMTFKVKNGSEGTTGERPTYPSPTGNTTSSTHTTENKTRVIPRKPSEVLDFQAEPTCDSVALTWKLPLKDGGMPIDKFVLEYKGSTRNIGASKTEITITGLKQNTDYTFNIRATNRGEWGPITSQQVKTEKYCVPGRPVIYQPKSVEIDQTSFTLKWRRPQATGGDDDIEYIVRYRDETDDDKPGPWKEFTTKKLEYKIKNLEKQKKYKVEVIAKNDAGKGTPDERFYQTGKVLGTGSQSQLVASLLLTFTVYILHLL